MTAAEAITSCSIYLVLAALTLALAAGVTLAVKADAAKAAELEAKKAGTVWASDLETQMGKDWVDSRNR